MIAASFTWMRCPRYVQGTADLYRPDFPEARFGIASCCEQLASVNECKAILCQLTKARLHKSFKLFSSEMHLLPEIVGVHESWS